MIEFSPISRVSGSQQWFLKRAPINVMVGTRGIVAHVKDEIYGIVVLDSWTENSCQIHVAIDRPICLKYGFWDEVCRYVFLESGRGIIYGITPEDNHKALKFNAHIGLQELYRLKDAYAIGIDMIVQEFRKEDYEQISSRAA